MYVKRIPPVARQVDGDIVAQNAGEEKRGRGRMKAGGNARMMSNLRDDRIKMKKMKKECRIHIFFFSSVISGDIMQVFKLSPPGFGRRSAQDGGASNEGIVEGGARAGFGDGRFFCAGGTR